MATLPDYAELHCLSNYSFLQGASHPEELVAEAARLGYRALAITDECSMAGVVRAFEEARRQSLPLLVGSHFQVQASATTPPLQLVALAQTLAGYGQLCQLITRARARAAKGSYTVLADDLLAHDTHGGLAECLVLLAPNPEDSPALLSEQARWVAQHFAGRAWLSLTRHLGALDALHQQQVLAAAHDVGLPVVATGRVVMHRRSRKPLHDTLTAIRLRTTVANCAHARHPNAEARLRSRLQLAQLYPAEALAQTLAIVARCPFRLDELRYQYPHEICPAGLTPTAYLRELAEAGVQQRFPAGLPATVRQQLEHELALIAQLKYEAYFLTVYDIVRFARSRDILCQGRGSAANSVVCYCLGITEVDPRRSRLLFERFISPERNEPPDIDVDFEHQRREEVIQYLYDKYGRHRAALTAVVIRYRTRSALRDTGRALGIDIALVDRVARACHQWDGRQPLALRMAEAGLPADSPMVLLWCRLVEQIYDFPRHLSQHPGGFVIGRGPLHELVPIEPAAMAGRSVVQWDKDDLDAMGLLKVDVLALGMLTMLRRALTLASARRGTPLRLQDIPEGDTATYDRICAADTIGTFQIESRAQMSMLPRLRPRCYYDLVVQVAIVRPGPVQGGMVHPYLRRRQGLEPVVFPGPAVETALARTLGVPIFQEQVMEVAILAAGFTPGEADTLRRSMAAWRRKGGLHHFQQRLVAGMTARGYPTAFAEQIFQQILGFGDYGFPESHAASFALLAYASAWMKCHEPEAFLAALLNSQPMGFYSAATLVQDARRHGVTVLPVDVQASDWEATLQPGTSRPAVRLGLNQVKGMREASALRLMAARAAGPFEHVASLAQRADLDTHDMQVLAKADALASLAGPRRQALWQARRGPAPDDLLAEAPAPEDITPLLPTPSPLEHAAADYRSLGLTLGDHPLVSLRPWLAAQRFLSAEQLQAQPDRRLVRAAGIVTVRQRPGTSKGVVFVTLEDESGTVNLVVFPQLAQRQRRELRQSRLLGAYGRWQSSEGVQHLVVDRLVDLSPRLGDVPSRSRDFH